MAASWAFQLDRYGGAAARVDHVRRPARLQPCADAAGPRHQQATAEAGFAAYLTGHTFFPFLISAPFQHGLAIAFDFASGACLIAAVASLLRGKKYVHVVMNPVVTSPVVIGES